MISIFGKDLLNDENLRFYFEQLTGIENVKPFECVGTVDEVNIAVNMLIKQISQNEMPLLLKYYQTLSFYAQYENINLHSFLNTFNDEHFLETEFVEILKANI